MHGRSSSLVGPLVAGLVLARCRCCEQPRDLEPHPELDANHRVCPASLRVYLDRGDGLFEDTGALLPARSGARRAAPPQEAEPGPEVLSDRPRRTDDKARIQLERATFA